MERDNDSATGRQFLTGSAYADDRHLRSRQAIFAYADATTEPGSRLSAVPWDGSQVVADVGCGNGFDLRQLVAQGRCRQAVGIDLSAGMLRSLADLQASGRLSLVQADAKELPLADDSVDVALAMHMLYHVSDIQAAVRELRRIIKPGGRLLASTNSAGSLSEVHELMNAAVGRLLGREVHALSALSFTTETGSAILSGTFSEVIVLDQETPLSFPDADPVVAYLDSVHEPILSDVGEPFDFDAALDDVATSVDQVIRTDGRFRVVVRAGVFVCR